MRDSYECERGARERTGGALEGCGCRGHSWNARTTLPSSWRPWPTSSTPTCSWSARTGWGRPSPASRLLGYQHGRHRARVDLKAYGTAPIVDLARLLALERAGRRRAPWLDCGPRPIRETAGRIAVDLAAAFADLQQLRLDHHAARRTAGAPADDSVALGELSLLQRRRLRETMQLIHVGQESLRIAYRTDLIA